MKISRTATLNIILSATIIIALFTSLHAQTVDSTWYHPNQLVNHPMPPITGTAIGGQAINSSFFKNSVTLVAFGNLINMNSLKEIDFLNQLQKNFAGHPFKILGVMPNAIQDVKDFNNPSADNTGEAHQLRMNFQLPVMEYPVLATCDQRNPDKSLRVACDNIIKDYLIVGYPVICLIDKKGIIRYVHVNLVPNDQQKDSLNLVLQQIEILLKEQ